MSWQPPNKPSSSLSFTPMFKTPTTRFLPSAKNMVTGVFLPGFDWGRFPNPNAPEFKTSYTPYRDATSVDETGHPKVLVPCAFIKVHTQVGPKRDDYVSPASREFLYRSENDFGSTEDPLQDIVAAASQESSPWHHLTKEGSVPNSKYPLLQWASTKCVFNVKAVNSKDMGGMPKQGLAFFSKTLLVEFQRLMNIPRMAGQVPVPRDPEWPDYLYGDVTNPNRPVEFRTLQRSNPTNETQKYTGVAFGSNEVNLMGVVSSPVITQEELNNRINIFDPTIYNILSYQELLDKLVADNWIPAELVKLACGAKGNIGGPQHTGQPEMAYQQPAAAPYVPQAQVPNYGPSVGHHAPAAAAAPYTPQAAAAPYTPPAPAADSLPMVHNYWVVGDDGVVVLKERAELQALILARRVDVMLMSEDQTSGWKPATQFGFALPVVPTAAPAPPSPPTAPAAPTPPSPPTAPAAQQPVWTNTAPAAAPVQAPYTPPAEDAPWSTGGSAQPPATPAASPLATLPYYSEYAGKSIDELRQSFNEYLSMASQGHMTEEIGKRLNVVRLLVKEKEGV